MKILSIFILHRTEYTDYVVLHTDLPSTLWPHSGNLELSFQCVAGGAEAYCATHWPGVPVEVVS
jgi:hypothetical protein